jgi:hypothetical protein
MLFTNITARYRILFYEVRVADGVVKPCRPPYDWAQRTIDYFEAAIKQFEHGSTRSIYVQRKKHGFSRARREIGPDFSPSVCAIR